MNSLRWNRLGTGIVPDGRTIRSGTLLILFLFCASSPHAQKPSKATQQKFWIVFEQLNVPWLSGFPYLDIFVMDQDGRETKRLTSNHRSHNPAWSPDGRQIAFLTDERAPLATATSSEDYDKFIQFRDFLTISRDVFRMDADGGNPTHIVSVGPDAQDLLFFPDGKRLGVRVSDRRASRVVVDITGAFLQAVVNGEPLNAYLNTTEPLLSGGYDPKYSELRVWVPPLDNFMPLFVSSRGFPGGMFFVSSRKFPYFSLSNFKGPPWEANLSSSLRVVPFDGTSRPLHVASYDIAWSPDGKRIAYSAFSGGQNSVIYVGEIQGEELETGRRALTTQTLDAHGPAWSADGSRIAFTGLWKDSSQIFAIGADGSNLVQLSNDSKLSCYHVSWSPDDNWIVADCRENEVEMQPFTYVLEGLSNIYLFDCPPTGYEAPTAYQVRTRINIPSTNLRCS